MAGIKQAMLSIMQKLATIDVLTRDRVPTKLYVRVWNDQIANEQKGMETIFPKPASFLEVINDAIYQEIGGGYAEADLIFRLHLCHDYYNEDGNFEQDLEIFDLRDTVIGMLNHFKADGTGPLTKIAEQQDANHNNIYHYIIDFTANFIDDAGSEDVNGGYIIKDPPTALDLTGEFVEGDPMGPEKKKIIVNSSTPNFKIPFNGA